MSVLVTIEELEKALGYTLEGTALTQAQDFIDQATGLIFSLVGHDFTEVTETRRMQADGKGCITFTLPRVSDVADVVPVAPSGAWDITLSPDPLYPGSDAYWEWDGLGEISGLRAGQVVDVTLTWGFAAVPDAVKAIARALVTRQAINPSGVRQETVGGISVTYASVFGEAGSLAPSKLETAVLSRYGVTEVSWRLR